MKSILLSVTLAFLSLSPLVAMRAQATPPTPSWQWANPTPQGNNLYASVTGGATSVAVGGNGTIYSNAGGPWAQRTSSTNEDLEGVTFGNGMFVAVGLAGTIVTSPDGATWTAATSPGTTQNLSSISFGNSIFVATGSNGTVFTSSDGTNWTENTIANVKTITNVTFGASVFVAVARGTINANAIYWSANGSSWTPGTIPPPAPVDFPFFVAWNGSEFVAMGTNSNSNGGASLLTSPDGKIWTLQSSKLLPATAFPLSLAVSGSDFVVMLQSAQAPGTVSTPIILETSPDGVNWTLQAANNLPADWSQNIPLQISCTTGSACMVVGASAYIATNSNFTNVTGWAPQSPTTVATYNRLRGVHAFNNIFFVVGDADTILTSPDGVKWTNENITVSPASNLRDIAYNGTRYVIVGSNGVVLTSADGASWTASTITPTVPSGTLFQALTWSGSQFVAVGTNGAIYTSQDGLTWIPQISGTTDNLGGVVWTGTEFVAVSDNAGSDGKLILTSLDGVKWASVAFNTGLATSLYGIHVNGATLVVAGSAASSSQPLAPIVAIIGTSTDGGSTWTVDTSKINDTFSDAMLTGSGAYAALGLNNGNIYTSTDGTTWAVQSPTVQNPMQNLAANCGVRVATGFAGVVLSNTAQPPTVDNGSISTMENTAFNGSLQSQACGGTLTFQVTQPAHGTVTIAAASGTFTYTPNQDFNGTDSFTFTTTNSAGVSAPAAETITVSSAGGTPPTAQNGSASTTEGTAVSGKLQATGGATTFTIKTSPAHGTVILNNAPTGAFTYTPASGFTGTDSFTFTASNGSGTSTPATETISVNASGGGGGGGGSSGGGGGGLGVLGLLLLTNLGLLRRRC